MTIPHTRTLKRLLGLAVMGLTILGCYGQGPDRNSTQDDTKTPDKKACFIVDPAKLSKNLRANPNINCIQDGSMSLAPIPDLLFRGIKYSTIDYSKDRQSSPAGFAFKVFNASAADGPERLEFLKTSLQLYDSVWMGLRSVDFKKHTRAIRELETVSAFIILQISRMGSKVPDIEGGLAFALKKCFQCDVKDSYNMIALASQSGVNPDKFLENLPGIRCKTGEACIDMFNKGGSNNSVPVNTSPPGSQKNFVTSNPALSNSSHLGLNYLTVLTFSISVLLRYAFSYYIL
ncbi:hypothetical protein Pst134EA_029498 [Puccinia striiformis f. sp. tritici]|uniref:hypothetical protein n=1 Tax=Puccinia striiformis f. sp. tritici TaxID=168172 RepID=UPI002008B309|nr:hypothetical protein Pst134EA_029498 [Puccinia striiformis f. sp. tritici]KAH9447462.1 hypothetical protein Pst134EA_029498 [Puccinia striiformis f. sp. tritici]